jgi:catalase
MRSKTTMTTTAGAPIADNQNSLTGGTRLVQDCQRSDAVAHRRCHLQKPLH